MLEEIENFHRKYAQGKMEGRRCSTLKISLGGKYIVAQIALKSKISGNTQN